MSKGYPSIVRVRKAWLQGYWGNRGRHRYTNPILARIWEKARRQWLEDRLAGQLKPPPASLLIKQRQKAEAMRRGAAQRSGLRGSRFVFRARC